MELPERVDVAVIGGGLAGLATAWAVRERGGHALVLERDAQIASHASGRNAAMCRALAEDDAWTALTTSGAAFLLDPPPGFAARPLVDRRGAVLLAGDVIAAELGARAARFGLRHERVADVEARWPGLSPRGGGGVWFPDDGNIDLTALIDAFAREAQIITGAEVTSVEHDGAAAVVATTQGTIRAAQVVIAAGPWSDLVAARAGASELGLISRRRHIIALAGNAGDAPIVWNVDGDEWYARPAGDRVWVSACDNDITAAGFIDVCEQDVDDARARSGRGGELMSAWACQRTFAAGAPVVARDADRPWLVRVVGLGGHGVTASATIGRAAATVLGQ